ncbi:MAG TPA: (2Fe-2S)-binding protein [Verrucomicrobiae bacterium]|nr:(2Fe-2S)-binding protein [Verrucomicrobiae bacterium]
MNERVNLRINGVSINVPKETVLAAAIAIARVPHFRKSISGQPRAPLCGMGICMECRVTINGQPHCRSCQVTCAEGMDVRTGL